MAAALLIVIYVVFIGLGVPDSAFGSAWPAVYSELDIAVSAAGLISIIISAGTIVSSLSTPRLLQWLGTGLLTALSTGLTAAGLICIARSQSLLHLCLSAIPLGVGAGAIDTALNSYVASNYSASQMSFLHCFYGIGVTISPYLISLMMTGSAGSWRDGYMMIFWIQIAITVLTFAALPLWKQVKSRMPEAGRTGGAGPLLTLKTNRRVLLSCLVFLTSCGIEGICGVWGSTYLVLEKGMNAAEGAGMLTLYYAGIAMGRFLSGVFVRYTGARRMLYFGETIVVAAVVALLFPLPAAAAAGMLFLVGLGNGPVYPNMTYLTPDNFGIGLMQGAMSLQIASSYISMLTIPTLFGPIAADIGFWLFSPVLVILAIPLVCGTVRLNHTSSQKMPRRSA